MNPDGWTVIGTIAGVLGLLVAVAGLIVAIVQTIRYVAIRRVLRKLHEREQLATWSLYDLTVQAYECVGEARTAMRGETAVPLTAVEKCAQVASLLNAMWLQTVQHAASLEERFDEDSIKRWEELGRLDNEWRISRARKLLPTPMSDDALP